MKKYWIDFSGYACVEAENEEEAERKMWKAIHNAFDGKEMFDVVCNIDGIEERNDEHSLLEPVYGRNPPTQEEMEAFWNQK